ncbi:MAG: glycosyltransferase family 4 protein [Bacteroidales bacterium]|nr:glycosyltransferase family 4 protein [Bacteroidales bacterium]
MFGWEFPPHITGGLGTACYGLTKGLSKHKAEVIFVVPKLFGDEDKTYVELTDAEKVTIFQTRKSFDEFWKNITYLQIDSTLLPYLDPQIFEKYIQQSFKISQEHIKEEAFETHFTFSGKYGADLITEVTRYAIVAGTIAKDHEFDIIHAHDWLTYPAGIAAKQASGKPLVVHVHATEFDRSGEHVNQTVFDIEQKGMQEADRVITVSHLTKQIVIERYGIDPSKVFTVHNAVEPVELEEFNITKHFDEKIVTFLGRITFQKGPEYFIEAAKKVLQKDKNVRFVMAGTGDMLHRSIERVAKLRMGDRFHFAGFLKPEMVNKLFSISDVYVMPSVSEPFGISPLEAMRSQVPVIISKQSGVSEILNHAIKIDFWDIDAMADSIHALLHYDGISKMFKTYGKTEIDHLKWENAAYNVIQVYNSLL